ncbi:hypothetical protein FHW36_11826 [Chitinophaga polysaccharea]|uniref:Uncharacterized protein n=1 Tax=Chitinophaga polysaccharea TaxID=1293035 RepID=A0A561P0S8_9BACT|nr:hypothetical protein [Chitinophaga polysaccharea]TWF31732.1 hypothetical protein FHW36_11826 [Chitinophaga polysaccharea]
MNIVVQKRPDPNSDNKAHELKVTNQLNIGIQKCLHEALKPLEQEINKYPDHKIIFTNEDQLGIVGLPPQVVYQIEYIFTKTNWLKL